MFFITPIRLFMKLTQKNLRQIKRLTVTAIVMTLAVQWLIPQNSVAAADVNHAIVNVILDEPLSLPEINPQIFPTSESREARYKIRVTVSAYSSTVDQTDDTPFITASGEVVRDGIVAANWLPLGAHIRIPEVYGDKVFVVEDRMNKRYSNRLDIWMPTRDDAKAWGLQYVTIEVL
ncbi:TPA: hypothetical protein DIC39_04010 [Patescibacteria group bacterium]|nr:hypothetical protein [Patescibacteria group bacterium]HCU48184.1 hypothetical protein [Patescibacteria group bacterium]